MPKLTDDQIKTKIRDVLMHEGDVQEGLIVLVIIPMLEDAGLKQPYSPSPELMNRYNTLVADVLDEMCILV